MSLQKLENNRNKTVVQEEVQILLLFPAAGLCALYENKCWQFEGS